MSAQDNLGPQFMSVEKLGKYTSMDYPGRTMDFAAAKIRQKEIRDPGFHQEMESLRTDIKANGFRRPLSIDSSGFTSDSGDPMVGDGHHRFTAAKQLGLKHLPVHEVL